MQLLVTQFKLISEICPIFKHSISYLNVAILSNTLKTTQTATLATAVTVCPQTNFVLAAAVWSTAVRHHSSLCNVKLVYKDEALYFIDCYF